MRNWKAEGTRIERFNRLTVYQVFTFILLASFLVCQPQVYAQLTLPTSVVLQAHGVAEIRVIQTAVRMENNSGIDISYMSFDSIPTKLATYFIHPNGRIDSIYQFAGSDTTYGKSIYHYDIRNRLSATYRIGPKGDSLEISLLERTAANELYLRSWNRGDLALEKKITADSIIYETVWHSKSQSRHHYHAITYDLEKDIQAETRYSTDDNEVIFSKNYQWITDNGVPDRFIYTNCFRGNERESMRNKTTEFKVAEDGSVINKHNGLFTDPFHMFNYYKRYEMFEGIPDPHERLLVEDHLLSEKEFAHLLKFDGTSVVYRFDISYVYR